MPIGGPIPFVIGGAAPGLTPSGEALYNLIPSVFVKDEEEDFFGKVLCNGLMDMWQHLDLIVEGAPEDIDPITRDESVGVKAHPGWATILDPVVCPEDWLEWCAALYGVTLTKNTTPEEQRTQIKELPPQKRGSITAMINAAKKTLTGTKTVNFEEQVEGKAYRILITTSEEETPSESATRTALLTQKPAGIKLIYEVGVAWKEATRKWEAVGAGVKWSTVKKPEVT